jgi:hypothetical protein
MMASWLYPIVTGEVDHAGDDTNIHTEEKSEPGTSAMATVSLGRMTTESKGKLPAKVDMAGAKVRARLFGLRLELLLLLDPKKHKSSQTPNF